MREVDHIIYDVLDKVVINLSYAIQVTRTTGVHQMMSQVVGLFRVMSPNDSQNSQLTLMLIDALISCHMNFHSG